MKFRPPFLKIIFTLWVSISTYAPLSAVTSENPSGSNPACWEISSGKATIYLFGSLHQLPAHAYPLPKIIEDAFEKSKVLAVEVDITKSCEVSFIKRLFLMINNTNMMGILNYYLSQKMNGSYDLGIERYFLSKGKKSEKKIIELEDLQTQLAMIASLQYKPKYASFDAQLKDLPSKKEMLKKLLQGWEKGDTESLYDCILWDKERILNYEEILFTKRNIAMTEAIKDFLKGEETIFFIVGALHFVGPNGILALLEKEGYQVKRLTEEK